VTIRKESETPVPEIHLVHSNLLRWEETRPPLEGLVACNRDLSDAEVLRITQGVSGNCHFVAALVSFLWARNPITVSVDSAGYNVGLFGADRLATEYTVRRVIDRDVFPQKGPYDRTGNNCFSELLGLIVGADCLRRGDPLQAPTQDDHAAPDFNLMNAELAFDDPNSVLDGLRALSGQPCSIFAQGALVTWLTQRLGEGQRTPTLLWSAGSTTDAAQDPHVYSVMGLCDDSVVVRDARATGKLTGATPVGYRNNSWVLDPNQAELQNGLFRLSITDLSERLSQIAGNFSWYIGGVNVPDS
jgi:hypothetical protein